MTNTNCPKCDSGTLRGPRYEPNHDPVWSSYDWLRYTCDRCGYVHREPPKDRRPHD